MNDPTLSQLAASGREIWPERLTLNHTALVLSKVAGDIAGLARDNAENPSGINPDDLMRELGNLLLTTSRAIKDLRLNPGRCVLVAETAQRKYALRLLREREGEGACSGCACSLAGCREGGGHCCDACQHHQPRPSHQTDDDGTQR
ncbi:hypothetical protein ACRYCC_26160 [Actinomadura scrupuli]|uniref:hypothetical protein n=1 Tax=Actinomadura scrupuli TaxID=559629 RepID=UPI003D98A510